MYTRTGRPCTVPAHFVTVRKIFLPIHELTTTKKINSLCVRPDWYTSKVTSHISNNENLSTEIKISVEVKQTEYLLSYSFR